MIDIRHWRLDECGSTNHYAASLSESDSPHGTLVSAFRQTAGRGQRGNSWESEPGKNLTFSMIIRPQSLPATAQFDISMAVALGVRDALAIIPGIDPDRLKIKWSNDIYYDDLKIAGILIENNLAGRNISRSIAGIGLNVNQTHFISDAPNPGSLCQITGTEYDLQNLLTDIRTAILARCATLDTLDRDGQPHPSLLNDLLSVLWRNDNRPHCYIDLRTDTSRTFSATITGIGRWGYLCLDGIPYPFKQLRAVL